MAKITNNVIAKCYPASKLTETVSGYDVQPDYAQCRYCGSCGTAKCGRKVARKVIKAVKLSKGNR